MPAIGGELDQLTALKNTFDVAALLRKFGGRKRAALLALLDADRVGAPTDR